MSEEELVVALKENGGVFNSYSELITLNYNKLDTFFKTLS